MVQKNRATSESWPGLRVLVVDDDRDAADSLAILLDMWGHRPRAAYDADAALRAVADERPDVVLLDLGLPGKDGFALAAELGAREGMRDTVLVAITGHTALAHRDRVKGSRFADVLIKPVEPAFLRKLLADRQAVRMRADAATG